MIGVLINPDIIPQIINISPIFLLNIFIFIINIIILFKIENTKCIGGLLECMLIIVNVTMQLLQLFMLYLFNVDDFEYIFVRLIGFIIFFIQIYIFIIII